MVGRKNKKVLSSSDSSDENMLEVDPRKGLVIENGSIVKYSHVPFLDLFLGNKFVLIVNGWFYRWRNSSNRKYFICPGCKRPFRADFGIKHSFRIVDIVAPAGKGHQVGCKATVPLDLIPAYNDRLLKLLDGSCYDATEDVVHVYNTKHNDPKNAQKPKKLNSPLLKDNDEIITGQMDAMNISGSSKINKDVNKEGMEVRPDGVQDDQNGIVSEESEATAVSTSSGDATPETSTYSSYSSRHGIRGPLGDNSAVTAWGEMYSD